MMTINKFKLIAMALVMGLVGVSCNDILDENVNPDRAHSLKAEEAMPVLVFYAQQTVYDHAEYYIYLSQCLTTGGKSSVGSYSYKCEWEFLTMNRHPQWRRHFYDIGVNGNNLIKEANKINSPNYTLIVRAIQLMSMQLTTDAFGDMPRTDAYNSVAPAYDTQESIYAWMLQEADDLIAAFEDESITKNENNQRITAAQDRVYAGDLEKWKGLVYAIKARLLLRNIPNIDRSPATCQKIIDAADAAINQWRKGDLLYGAWFGNEPRYNFDGGTNEQCAPWSVTHPVINSWESRSNLLGNAIPSKFFLVDVMGLNEPDNENFIGTYHGTQGSSYDGYANDPRLPLLMKARTGPVSPSKAEDSKVMMRFLENNIGMGTTYKGTNYPDLYMGAYAGATNAYNPIFTMEELYFIKAEAYYWMGNKTEACALAKEAAEHNIERHLDFFLKNYPNPNYNEKNDNKYPGEYKDAGTVQWARATDWNAQVNAFLNNEEYYASASAKTPRVKKVTDRGNKHWFFNPSEFSLSDLMMQKYVAMYMQPEQWTDMRRYHYSNKRNNYGIGNDNEIVYPGLRRPYNLYAAYWVDGLTDAQKENTWIQRLNYDPETEEKYNRGELERLGAYKNYKWLQKPMIWAHDYGEVTSLTGQ